MELAASQKHLPASIHTGLGFFCLRTFPRLVASWSESWADTDDACPAIIPDTARSEDAKLNVAESRHDDSCNCNLK